MADLLVDTDVFVDHLRGRARLRPGRNRLLYSVITRAELFAGRNVDESAVGKLLGPFGEIEVDRDIAEEAGRIRREAGVSLPDCLIAATARLKGIPVVTRNRRHFERVPRLRVRSPS
jgi:predicted nucleic acid-binding protein